MTENIEYRGELKVHRCWCSITFAIPVELYDEYQRSDTMYIYCPLGHHMRPVLKGSIKDQLKGMTEQKEHYRHEYIKNKIKEK